MEIEVKSSSRIQNNWRSHCERVKRLHPRSVESLDVEEMIANLLAAEGFLSVEELAQAELSEIQSIEGFDEDIAKEIKRRAEEYLQKTA
jgi:N utilization substance protein A